MVDAFSALAEPTRRRIIELLARHGQLSASEIYAQFPVSDPAISQHLKVLREAGLVQVEKRAQQRIYRINPKALLELEDWAGRMARLWNERFDALGEVLESEKMRLREVEMSKNELVIEREQLAVSMSRVFDAPRDLVWKACTDATLLPQWWGPRALTTVVERMDLRVGGVWRFIQTNAEGNEFAFNGVFKEVKPPERLVYTFEYEPMAGHISVDAITLEELPDGRTKMISRSTFDSLEDLEGLLQSGMEEGATETWDRLEELLAREKAG